jgi:predicted RNA methylase
LSSALSQSLADPGYTPPSSALPELVAALADLPEADQKKLRRVLGRSGKAGLAATLTALPGAPASLREQLFTLFGSFAEDDEAATERVLEPLVAGLADQEPRCRRSAARALGKLGEPRAEAPLLAALVEADPAERRAIVDALGKLGGDASRDALASLVGSDDDLARRIDNARTLLERRASRRGDESKMLLDRATPHALRLLARCRSGLSGVLRDEAAATFRVLEATDTSVEFEHRGSLGELCALRTALDFAVALPLPDEPAEPAERIARALESPEALGVFQAWCSGRPRVRLEFTGSGHQRALAWAVARRLSAGGKVLNDPHSASFSAEVHPSARGRLLLIPKLSPDPRFHYRVSDVSAASHPTVAAALARLGGLRDDDVVWDPFVGSGLELVERARLGPYARLIGTDIDPKALRAATENTASVERVELVRADSTQHSPSGVTLILSNPPMGRRVARDGSLRPLLESFVKHAARVLVPGGRWLWLSPLPELTARAAEQHGLSVAPGPEVDLGGFSARIQAITRIKPRSPRPRP